MVKRNGKEVLCLPLKKGPFDVMITGEKNQEFRKSKGTGWIETRLYSNFSQDGEPLEGRVYGYVLFRNGYGDDKPYFICEYKGFYVAPEDFVKTYSNGFRVEVKKGDFIIRLGKIVEKGNI